MTNMLSDKKYEYSVAFATNGIAHHMTNLSEAFIRNPFVREYALIIIGKTSQDEEYKRLGKDDYIDCRLVRIIDTSVDRETAQDVINKFDIVIATYDHKDIIRERIKAGKITFVFSERIFKKYDDSQVLSWAKNCLRFVKYKILLTVDGYYRENVYFLTAGKHAKRDYKVLGVKEARIIPFGYFPKGVVAERDSTEKPDPVTHLLWVGRLVPWKHPEYSIYTYRHLVRGGYKVDLTIVGNGMMENVIKSLIAPEDDIFMKGGIPTEEVRRTMRKSDIFLFTSNEGEGWGMVLSEAMAEGCVPVASYSAGATTELVKDGVNGFIYYNNNIEELYRKTKILVMNHILYTEMQEKCYETIENEWNADSAVKTLIDMYSKIIRTEKKLDINMDG